MPGRSLEMWCTTVSAPPREHAVHVATRPPTRGGGRAGEVPHRTRPKRAKTSASRAWAAMRQLGQGGANDMMPMRYDVDVHREICRWRPRDLTESQNQKSKIGGRKRSARMAILSKSRRI
ncbi:hypothetical protein T492DRAFT_841090 [Pavlovales sp. CCMP2436]|nr:hypothetical protein T492DRAFT_841090 [Pavlovales sp. CCMP2436]